MKINVISNTHGRHRLLSPPSGDMIIHAGDISDVGREEEIADFFDWFSGLDFPHKILIAGNHDFFFELASFERVKAMLPDDVIYLNDSGVTIDGIRIWGSPITPWFNNWAFNRQRGADIKNTGN